MALDGTLYWRVYDPLTIWIFFDTAPSFEAWEAHRYLKNRLGIVHARGGGLLDHPYAPIWIFIWTKYCPFMKLNVWVKYFPKRLLHRGTIFGPNKTPNPLTNWMCRRRFTGKTYWQIWITLGTKTVVWLIPCRF